jgi:hypothetical protein
MPGRVARLMTGLWGANGRHLLTPVLELGLKRSSEYPLLRRREVVKRQSKFWLPKVYTIRAPVTCTISYLENRSIKELRCQAPRPHTTLRMSSNYDRFKMFVSECLINLGSQDYGGLNQRKPALKTDNNMVSAGVKPGGKVDEGQIGRDRITP